MKMTSLAVQFHYINKLFLKLVFSLKRLLFVLSIFNRKGIVNVIATSTNLLTMR